MILKIGSSGSRVKVWQTFLNANKFGQLVVDGVFGKVTAEAVKRFQGVVGLTSDGIIGPASEAARERFRPSQTKALTVALDAGHGGKDPGARGIEADLNLRIALEVKRLLVEAGIKVIMTRDDNTYLALSARAKIANDSKADLFVSIHHNAGGGDGFEIIYQCDPTVSIKSKVLAESIAKEFEKLQNKRRVFCRPSVKNPKEDYYAVLAKANMPAIITEFAFLDSPDIAAIDTMSEELAEAKAIAMGVMNYRSSGAA